MFISETYFHLDQPGCLRRDQKAFTDLAYFINTPADIEYFMGLQELLSLLPSMSVSKTVLS